ncbi:hypothetical protein D3C72_1902910 [compost metagenome]
MVFLGVLQLGGEDVAAHVVLVLLAQGDALAQRGAHFVFQLEVGTQHVGHRITGMDGPGAHVRGAFQEEDALQQGVGVLGLLFHLVVDTLEQLVEAPVLVHPRMQEVLVPGSQFAAQQVLEVFHDFGLALHLHIS